MGAREARGVGVRGGEGGTEIRFLPILSYPGVRQTEKKTSRVVDQYVGCIGRHVICC